MKNINKEVWRYLDNNLPIKNHLYDNLINVRALAKSILKELKLNCSLNSIISAIRRYENEPSKKDKISKLYKVLQKAKLTTKTKLTSILLRKNSRVRSKLVELYTKIDFEGGDILRIFEVSKNIKVIIDEKTLKEINNLFSTNDIVTKEKNIGELNITYDADITKVSGLFALLSNELASNNISIIDSIICHSEHIILVTEKDIQKAFNVIFNLIHKK